MSFPAPTPKQARIIWFAVTALAAALTVAIVGALFWGLGQAVVRLSPVLWPIAVAGIIAFILDPVVGWLVARRVPRIRAVLLVFGAAGFLVLGLFGSLVPRLVVEASNLVGQIPDYARVAGHRWESWINNPQTPLRRLVPEGWQKYLPGGAASPSNAPAGLGHGPGLDVAVLSPSASAGAGAGAGAPAPAVPETQPVPRPGAAEADAGTAAATSPAEVRVPAWWISALDPKAIRTAGDWIATALPEVGRWTLGQVGRVASLLGILAGLALIPIYAFYFLLEKSSIERRWTDYLPVANSAFKDELVWLLKNINDALIVFFRGQVLVAMCDGALYMVGFLLIGLPYALLLGMVAAVLTIVPFLGAIVTCVTALVIAIIQFGDWQHPLLVLAVFAVVQTIEGWVIQPKIIGDRVGLHPVTIIIALLVGTTLMGGLLGGLLAIPATAVLRALMFRYVWRSPVGGGMGSALANHSEKTG